ncbi:MAG TPA: GFA family protein [Myxococcota bacterium]|nr:GFA family protein [Myxococcota bacterium]
MAAAEPAFEGGCLCGDVRYRAVGPATNRCFCHCRSCRLASGAPFVAWATVPAGGFALTRGALASHRSSARVARGFCARCGTALTYAHDARPEELDLALATLDEPGAISPECHIWVSHRLPWIALTDGLPSYEEWRTP